MHLSQIQNLSLHHPAIVETPILDDVPVDVRLAVLAPSGLPQKHDGTDRGAKPDGNRVGLHYSPF